jgi:hypothetical protein
VASANGRESVNSEYKEMLNNSSKLMSLYNDEIVRQFLAARRESLVQHEESIVED